MRHAENIIAAVLNWNRNVKGNLWLTSARVVGPGRPDWDIHTSR